MHFIRIKDIFWTVQVAFNSEISRKKFLSLLFEGKAICISAALTWAWGGYGGISPQGPPYLRPKLAGGYGNFFHVVKNFSEKPATFFFLLAAGEIFGSLGVYTPSPQPEVATPPPPPQRKKRAHQVHAKEEESSGTTATTTADLCSRKRRHYAACIYSKTAHAWRTSGGWLDTAYIR